MFSPTPPSPLITPSPELESDTIAMVKARLIRRCPQLPADYVAGVVENTYHSFDDSRVRMFVPVLVEHAAREELVARSGTALMQ